jgi:hypothetical protein
MWLEDVQWKWTGRVSSAVARQDPRYHQYCRAVMLLGLYVTRVLAVFSRHGSDDLRTSTIPARPDFVCTEARIIC